MLNIYSAWVADAASASVTVCIHMFKFFSIQVFLYIYFIFSTVYSQKWIGQTFLDS
jgi:hypothetical protein